MFTVYENALTQVQHTEIPAYLHIKDDDLDVVGFYLRKILRAVGGKEGNLICISCDYRN